MQTASLETLAAQGLITDVVGTVKSGKEATVYCCRAGPSTGVELLAAKVFRPLEGRGFRNDAVYQQGRVILDARSARALKKKSRHGRRVQFGTWVGAEYETLQLLHRAGADVPRPVAQSGSAILMEYVGDRESPAPILNSTSLSKDEARRAFRRITRNVELLLTWNRVHADLSAFNILYWRGGVRIIDFPQAVDPRVNPNAYRLLTRDVGNVCRYFARYGVEANASQIAAGLWTRFLRAGL